MRFGIFVPNFGTFADPLWLARLAGDAEAAGWEGLFVWDHVDYRGSWPVADPWVALAAVATATKTMRIGTLVTPLPRRRPQVLARQTVTLDHLSGGRLTLGVGLGGDGSRELSAFGDEVDDRVRAAMADEHLTVLTALWSGETVRHVGTYYRAEGVRFLPRPVQDPRIPIWVGAVGDRLGPWRRASRVDGVFPIRVGPAAVARLLAQVDVRDGFDIVVESRDGPWSDFAAVGATWWLQAFDPGAPADAVRATVAAGPPPP